MRACHVQSQADAIIWPHSHARIRLPQPTLNAVRIDPALSKPRDDCSISRCLACEILILQAHLRVYKAVADLGIRILVDSFRPEAKGFRKPSQPLLIMGSSRRRRVPEAGQGPCEIESGISRTGPVIKTARIEVVGEQIAHCKKRGFDQLQVFGCCDQLLTSNVGVTDILRITLERCQSCVSLVGPATEDFRRVAEVGWLCPDEIQACEQV